MVIKRPANSSSMVCTLGLNLGFRPQTQKLELYVLYNVMDSTTGKYPFHFNGLHFEISSKDSKARTTFKQLAGIIQCHW